jgi:hypothetical protein
MLDDALRMLVLMTVANRCAEKARGRTRDRTPTRRGRRSRAGPVLPSMRMPSGCRRASSPSVTSITSGRRSSRLDVSGRHEVLLRLARRHVPVLRPRAGRGGVLHDPPSRPRRIPSRRVVRNHPIALRRSRISLTPASSCSSSRPIFMRDPVDARVDALLTVGDLQTHPWKRGSRS